MTLIDELKNFQKANGLTQSDLEKILAFSPGLVNSWMMGINFPNTTEQYRILNLLEKYRLQDDSDNKKTH